MIFREWRIENFYDWSRSGTIAVLSGWAWGTGASRLKLYASTAMASPLDPFGLTDGT